MPKSEVPGEESSPTQPFPTKPPPFARQVFKVEDVNPFMSPEEQEKLRQAVRDAANEGLFTPSSEKRYHIQFPGAWGGANWGSTAADPATGMLFVRSLEMPSYRTMSQVTTKPGPPQIKGGARSSRATPRSRRSAPPATVPARSRCDRRPALGADDFRKLIRAGTGPDAGVLRVDAAAPTASMRSKRI